MKCALSAGVAWLVLSSASLASYALINGDFETGNLAGWTLTGSGSAKDSTVGITPTQGSYQGYIETTGNSTASAPVVATALGIDGSDLLPFGIGGAPVNGTGISQPISVSAGDVLSFDWNFLSDELNETATYNDFAFFVVDGSAYFLASRNASTWNTSSPPAGFDGQTDWDTYTYTFLAAGTFLIGWGTFNVGDTGHNSALLLDAVTLSVPEPAFAPVLTLAGLFLLRRRPG